MIRPWQDIIDHYEGFKGEDRSIRALATIARRISETPLSSLFAWTSMLDLCIVQTEVTYPYDGPLLRLSPTSKDQIELRYVDTMIEAKQWRGPWMRTRHFRASPSSLTS
jgi:hypothetical protein